MLAAGKCSLQSQTYAKCMYFATSVGSCWYFLVLLFSTFCPFVILSVCVSVAYRLMYAKPIYFSIPVGKVEARTPLWNINFSACPPPFIRVCKVNLNFSFLGGIHSTRPLLPKEERKVPQSAENPQLPIIRNNQQCLACFVENDRKKYRKCLKM